MEIYSKFTKSFSSINC